MGLDISEARRQFPHTWTDTIYLNHAAISPMSFRVRDAVDKYLTKRSLKGIEPYPWALKMAQETKGLIASTINCCADQVAFVLNTSDGLNVLATGLDWSRGDHLLIHKVEFPSNQYPFLNLVRRGVNVEVFDTADRFVTAAAIAERIRPETKIVSVSAVQFLTGEKLDLAAIGTLCREKNILFCVDAIQAIPHSPIDFAGMHIDFLATGSHKWLMSPEGTGFIVVGDRALAQITQSNLGWTSVANPFDHLNLDVARLRPDAGRFENGTLNYPGISGLNAALKMFHEFGLQDIERHILDLTDYLVDRLSTHGFAIVTPLERERRAGIVTFEAVDPESMHARLLEKNIVISLRGGKLRVSPHFYNTEDELRMFINALVE